MGLWQLFDKGLVGLDIGVSGIKAVELSSGRTRRLMAYNRIPLPWNTISPDGEIKDREAVVSALRTLFGTKEFTSRRVAIAGFGNAVITKKIQVDRMKEEELREQIYWEAEQYIPFDVNDVNLDCALLGPSVTPNKIDVLLVAAKKEYIQSLNEIVSAASLEPAVVDTQTFALGNAFEYNYNHVVDLVPGGSNCILIDFGAGSTKVTMFEGDNATFSRELRQCGLSCTLMLSERLGVSLDEAENLKLADYESPSVSTLLDEFNVALADEVARTIDFALSQSSDTSLNSIFVCGGGSKGYGVLEVLERKLSAPIRPLNPVQNVVGSGKRMNAQAVAELTYLGAVAIGLALRTGAA